MGNNTKPIVEVHHRHASDLEERCRRVEQVEKAISSTTLGRIWLASAGEEGDPLQGNSFNALGELSHNEAFPNSQSNQDMRSLE